MEKQHLLEYENFSWLITKTRSRDVSLSLFASFPSNRDPRTKAWKALESLSLSPSSGKRQRAWKRNERTEKEARVKVVFDSSWIETCLTWACDTQPNTQGRYAPFPCSNYNNIWPRKIKFFHFFFFYHQGTRIYLWRRRLFPSLFPELIFDGRVNDIDGINWKDIFKGESKVERELFWVLLKIYIHSSSFLEYVQESTIHDIFLTKWTQDSCRRTRIRVFHCVRPYHRRPSTKNLSLV